MEDVFVSLIERGRKEGSMNFRRLRAIAKKEAAAHRARPAQPYLGPRAAAGHAAAVRLRAELDVDRIPTIVYDQDHTPQSRELIDQFRARAISRSSRRQRLSTPSSGDRQRTRPAGRSSFPRISRAMCWPVEPEADVQLLIDGSDSNTAAIALGYADAVVQSYAARSALECAESSTAGQAAAECPWSRASASGTTAI